MSWKSKRRKKEKERLARKPKTLLGVENNLIGFNEPTTYQASYKGHTGYCTSTYVAHRQHKGDPIQIGKYVVLAGAMRDLTVDDLSKADVIVPLTQDIPYMDFGKAYRILAAPLVDYGGVPDNWEEFLRTLVVPLIEGGSTLLAYCVGSHGRTGTFLASLIAIMEPETADPIAAARERHCHKCVESVKQARAIFALRKEELPEKYETEFKPVFTQYVGQPYGSYGSFPAASVGVVSNPAGYYDDWNTRFGDLDAAVAEAANDGRPSVNDKRRVDVRLGRDRNHNWGY